MPKFRIAKYLDTWYLARGDEIISRSKFWHDIIKTKTDREPHDLNYNKGYRLFCDCSYCYYYIRYRKWI